MIQEEGMGMRRRCVSLKWLGGIVLIAMGMGMLLAYLIPKCVCLIGVLLVGVGVWLISQKKRC